MTTTPSPELPDLDRLEALARAVKSAIGYGDFSAAIVKLQDDLDADTVLALIALARRAQPEGEAPQAEAFAWAVFAENGNVIIWSKKRSEVEPASEKYGRPIVPVVALSAAQHADSGAQAELPELPAPWGTMYGHRDGCRELDGYTADQMRGYAIDYAALAAQSQGAQAAGEFRTCCDHPDCTTCAGRGGHYRLAAKAEAPAPGWGRVETVGDMVRKLLTLDQAAPIFTAHHLDIDGQRRCRTRPVTISRERVIDGKWVDPARKDVPYANIVWAKPDERAQQAAAPGAEPVEPPRMTTDESREYLVKFMEKHFTDKTYHRYIRGERGSVNLAGDFAWQMARALRMLEAAPSAPGTPEAPAELPRLYRFDCYVGKTKMAAGVGVHATSMEEAEQKARELADKDETVKFESNRPCHATRKCGICAAYERAAQLDGGQGEERSNICRRAT